MVQFAKFTKKQQKLVNQITDRAHNLFKDQGMIRSKMDIEMDISATHENCELNLKQLKDFDDNNFTHDILGICKNLNRNTGELENCFLPRCAK